MQHIKHKTFFGILVTALVLVAMMSPAQAATWDTTRVYTGTVTLYDVAVGDKIKGASDDTVRIFTAQAGSPYRVLLFTDRSTALPMSWAYDSIMVDTAAIRGVAIGDVDRDGDNDLIWGRSGSPYRLKRAYWDGSAWVKQIIGTMPGAIYDVAVGDADNDGNSDDIIIANSYFVFRARWNGATWDTTRIFHGTSTTGTAYGVAIGDFDAAYAGNEIVLATYGQKVFRIRWTGAAWDSATIYTTTNDFDFYDVTVGDFDASNPGAEIAINNGYNYYQYGGGAVMELFGSGSSWTMRALYTPASGQWSSSGEIAVGDFFTTNPGAEIIAVSGSTPYEARLVYGSGTTWSSERTFLATGATYGCAIGNINRYRPGNEIALTSYYRVFEEEQKLLTNDMAAISVDGVPSMAETDEIITIKATVRNNAEYTANAPIPVKLRIDGPLGYVYTDVDQVTSLNLAPGGTEQIIFSPDWFVPDTLCSYTIKVWTELPGDEVAANDTVTKIVTVIRVGGIVESFTGTTFPPAGWTVYNFFTTADDAWSRYTVYYNSTPACARIYYDVPNNDWLITPRLKVVDGDKFKYWWRTQSTSYTETLSVRVSTNPNVSDTASYVQVGMVSSIGNIAWREEVVDLSAYAGQDVYVAFFYGCNNNYGVAIDDVSGPYFPPKIQTSPDSIYVESFPDSFFDVFFYIKNIGGGTLNYTTSLAGSSSWGTVHPTSGSLLGSEQDEDTLSINTTGMDGHYYDTLVITSNSGEKATSLIPIHIWVRLIPNIVISPDSFAVGVEANGTKDTAMYLSNTGNGELNYTIDVEEWGKSGAIYEGEPATRPHKWEDNIEELANIPEKDRPPMGWGTTPAKGLGGPDAFGYKWIDSDEPGGPTFSWIEINAIGTQVLPSDDGNVGPYDIGFPFEFYENTFTQFRIASNGFATFTSTSGTLTNAIIPTTGEPNNLLALMWDDLRPASGGGSGNIYYHSNSERLVIEWDHVIRYGQTACPFTMEIILYPNGKIIYQYKQMGDGTCTYLNQSTIGIENGTGTDGLEVVFNAVYVHDNLAIRFSSAPSWVVVSPELGTIPVSGTDTIDVGFDATGILGGEFYGGLVVNSNDPDNPVDTVPVHMHVLSPAMTFSPDSIITTATEGQAPFDLTMDVGNTGDGQLVFSITEGMPWLSVAPTTDTVLSGDPASTVTLTINAGSLYAGHYHGELKIYNNDPDLQPYATFQVYLTVGPNPDIAVSPDSFYVGIYAGYTKDTTLKISNTGAGHLTWGIGIEEIGKGGDTTLFEGFESGTFPPTGWTVVNNDGGTQTWTDYTTYYHSGTHSTSCRWESTTLWNDDWLISPRISVGSNDTLSFWYRAYSATWPESLEVRLSTTTADPSAFTHLLWAGSQLVNTTFEEMKIEVGSKFARGQVYIAFVYKGLNEFRIYLDDISVRSYAGPWLTLNPTSGVTDPGSSENVGVRFSAVGIEDDMYANLWVFSNDPDENPILVPVHMAVLGPNYSVSPPETLVIDALEGQYTDGHVFMGNYSGHAPLAYKITDPVAWLSETPDTAEVPIDGAQDVAVTVDGNLLIAGDYATKLYISTNDFDIPKDTLVVIVHMGPPPDISVSPESLRVVVPGGSTSNATLTINNDGDGHLAFDITTEETGPKAISGLKDRFAEILKSHASEKFMANSLPADQSGTASLSSTRDSGPMLAGSAGGGSVKAGGDTVYVQWPHDPTDTWSMGSSDAGAGYKIYENFWGVTLPIKGVQFWGLCLKYSGGWVAGNPANLVFDVTFYSDPADDPTMPPTQVACTYDNVVPPVIINTGLLFSGYSLYMFGGLELDPLCTLDEGWVAIQSQSAGSGYDWLLWASAKTGDGYSYQQGSTTPDRLYDQALLMTGGANWLVVSPEADTVNPHSSTNVNVLFDATNILGGDKYGDIIIASNDPDKSPLIVPAHMIVAGANYSVHPMELDINALEDQITPAGLVISNPGGIGTLSFKLTWTVPWLTAIPDTADVLPDGSENVTVRIDGNQLIAGEYYTEILVKSNAANQQFDTIPVYVHVGPNPDIDLSQTSFNVRMNPGVNLDVPLRVNNLGLGHLKFETEIASAKPEGKADVLLVDDDGTYYITTFTDARSYFTNALTANGYTYDVFEVTAAGTDGPSAATMAGYGAVIWFTGECWQLSQTLTVNDEANLGAYLDGGGNLFLSAQDYFYDRYPSAGSFSAGQFPYDYLRVSNVGQDVWTIVNPATGSCVGKTGSLTDGMSFSLWDPYTTKSPYGKGVDDGLYIDQLTHSGTDLFQMTNPTPAGIAALQYASPKGFKVVFTTIDFAGITDGAAPNTKNELMKRIMEWFAGGGGPATCPFTVNPEADILEPTSFEDVILSFDGSAFEACVDETLYCNLIFTTNDPDELIITVPVTVWAGRGDVFTPPGLLDIGDVVFLVNYILKNGPAPNPICMGDLALPHDDMVDMSDLIYLLQYLFEAGPPPVVTPAVTPASMQR